MKASKYNKELNKLLVLFQKLNTLINYLPIDSDKIKLLNNELQQLENKINNKIEKYTVIYQNIAPVEFDNDSRNDFKTIYKEKEFETFKEFRKFLRTEYKDSYVYSSIDLKFNIFTKEIEVNGYEFIPSSKNQNPPKTGYISKISNREVYYPSIIEDNKEIEDIEEEEKPDRKSNKKNNKSNDDDKFSYII